MQVLLTLTTIALLAFMGWQDLKYRGISWLLFPIVLVLLLLLFRYDPLSWDFLSSVTYNLSFLIIQLGLLVFYFRTKNITIRELLSSYMGLGDVLFFLVLALVLPFPLFPLFMTFSLILSLIAGIILFKGKTIPLAGIQAFLLGLLIPFNIHEILTLDQIYF